jgi:hypothetical protein
MLRQYGGDWQRIEPSSLRCFLLELFYFLFLRIMRNDAISDKKTKMNETKTDDLLVDYWGERPTNSDEQKSNPNRIPENDASEKLVRRWGIRRPNRHSHRPSSDDANDDDENDHLEPAIDKSEMRDECDVNNGSSESHVDGDSDDDISYGPCSSQKQSYTSSSEEGEIEMEKRFWQIMH